LQRRHQKLVEEAPAPFLSKAQIDQLYSASKAIIKEAGYVGAGTCEFLVGLDGTISFLEVNTRLQVEHPVSEEVTGLDLVREQFRIATGERLSFSDPEIRGHSIEFRINGEDPGKNFLPTPGVITAWKTPSGPGVRVDAGFTTGDVISGNFDSLLAKLIVTGSTRAQALERARRALDEFVVDGIATALPFHRAVVRDGAFTSDAFRVFTGWIESEFDNQIPPFTGTAEAHDDQMIERLVVEVDGHRLEVGLVSEQPKRRRSHSVQSFKNRGDALTSPMQGTVVKIAVHDGDEVTEGDLIVVLEAMKMEQPLIAHKSGRIQGLVMAVGSNIASGATICEIK
jgi:acetyl-CoA/propionyl-CoA carboxylase biotin carboxyl carrier protein